MDGQKLQGRFGYNTLYVLFFSCIVTGFYVSGLAYSFKFFRQIPIELNRFAVARCPAD